MFTQVLVIIYGHGLEYFSIGIQRS